MNRKVLISTILTFLLVAFLMLAGCTQPEKEPKAHSFPENVDTTTRLVLQDTIAYLVNFAFMDSLPVKYPIKISKGYSIDDCENFVCIQGKNTNKLYTKELFFETRHNIMQQSLTHGFDLDKYSVIVTDTNFVYARKVFLSKEELRENAEQDSLIKQNSKR